MATTRFFIGGTGASATIHINDDGSCELVIYDYHGDTVECRDYKNYRGARTALGIFSGGFQREVTPEEYSAFDRYEWCGGKHEESEVEAEPVLEISRINFKTETFATPWNGKLYCVDIFEDAEERSAWLYRADYCTKTYMFGEDVRNDRDEFLDCVFSNLPDYIDSYEDDMDAQEQLFLARLERGDFD